MSINHILKDVVPDDEKLDVHFGNVYCDQVITGSGPGPIPVEEAEGFVDAFTGAFIASNTTGVVVSSQFFDQSTASKNHSTFIWNVSSTIFINTATNLYEMNMTIPTAIKNYFDTHPWAFNNGYMSVQGASNTTTATTSFVANMMYFASNVIKTTDSSIRVTMKSFSGDGSGSLPSQQTLNLQILFFGPPQERR